MANHYFLSLSFLLHYIPPTIVHFELFTGVFSIFCIRGSYFRHDMLPVHTCPLAIFRGQYLRLGTIRMASGQRNMFANCLTLVAFRIY